MVKVVEDIVFYCYGWLFLCNDVGFDLMLFVLLVVDFYVVMVDCVEYWLCVMFIIVMYDYKCGEDVCVCFVVLSEILKVWWEYVEWWLVLLLVEGVDFSDVYMLF